MFILNYVDKLTMDFLFSFYYTISIDLIKNKVKYLCSQKDKNKF